MKGSYIGKLLGTPVNSSNSDYTPSICLTGTILIIIQHSLQKSTN